MMTARANGGNFFIGMIALFLLSGCVSLNRAGKNADQAMLNELYLINIIAYPEINQYIETRIKQIQKRLEEEK